LDVPINQPGRAAKKFELKSTLKANVGDVVPGHPSESPTNKQISCEIE
jgi:hypothetical protein